MSSDLDCPLCHNQYRSDNIPRVLTSCGHTYCHSCLDTMIVQGETSYRIVCPEDNIVVELKSNEITQCLPRNQQLIKLIEGKKNNNSSSKDESSLQITKIQRYEDSRGNESQQEIINQINTSNRSLQIQENKSKNNGSNVQLGEKNSKLLQETSTKQKQKQLPKASQDLCLVHQKPLQIVCMVDLERICSKCAIFGRHKGHEFKSIDQIEEQCNLLHQDILKVYSSQQDIMNQWKQINKKQIVQILQANKRKLIKQINDKYKKIRDAINKSEQSLLSKIDEYNDILQQKINLVLKVDDGIMKQYTKFENESFGIIIKFEQSTIYQQKLSMLYDNQINNILFKGKDIVSKIKTQHNNIVNKIQKIINSIKVYYNDQIFNSIEKFSIAKIQEDKIYLKEQIKEHKQDQSLLQFEVEESQNLIQNSNHMYQTHNISSTPSTISVNNYTQPKVIINKVEQKVQFKVESYIKPRQSSNIYEYQPQKIQRPPKKKLKSIKVPQKIEKILESLYNDTIETLDLTNAELGDAIILQICQFLKGTRVRTVKFIRNKLSDDAVGKMVSSFSGVSTLNLSQNFLTEQSLVHLANARNNMPNLRTVILSQNKIIERKHKQFIDKLKKMDLNVST